MITTVHNYIYAQQQMELSGMDCSEGVNQQHVEEEVCVLFPDPAFPGEVHPMLVYCGC